jgi:hypothetical protein
MKPNVNEFIKGSRQLVAKTSEATSQQACLLGSAREFCLEGLKFAKRIRCVAPFWQSQNQTHRCTQPNKIKENPQTSFLMMKFEDFLPPNVLSF